MKRIFIAASVLAIALILAGCATGRSTYYGRHRFAPADSTARMTKADVIRLSQAKLGDGVIINMIKSSGSYFTLRSNDVVELADSGVSDTVINAMITTTEPSGEGNHAHAYYVYPSWYAGYWYDPFWDPWYPSFYAGFGARFYRPFHGFYARGGFRGRR